MVIIGLLLGSLFLGISLLFIRSELLAKWIMLIASGVGVGVMVGVGLVLRHGGSFGFAYPWIPQLGVNFLFLINGLSWTMGILTVVTMGVVVAMSNRRPVYYALLAFVQFGLLSLFFAADLWVFYVAWEAVLIPIYALLMGWGGENRRMATIRFIVVTMLGSLLMLVAFILLFIGMPSPHSMMLDAVLSGFGGPLWLRVGILGCIGLAFAIKVPIVPFHMWQPDLYETADDSTVLVLAALLSKMGVYGIVRILLPLMMAVPHSIQIVGIGFVLLGGGYAALIACRESHFRRLIAYWSVAHLSVIVAGILAMNVAGIVGGMTQAVAHGINVLGLLVVGQILFRSSGSWNIAAFGGWWTKSRCLSAMFFIIILANIAFPLTNSFAAEWVILWSVFNVHWGLSVAIGSLAVVGAVVGLRLYQTVMVGPGSDGGGVLLTRTDRMVLGWVVAIIFITGCVPNWIIAPIVNTFPAVSVERPVGLTGVGGYQ